MKAPEIVQTEGSGEQESTVVQEAVQRSNAALLEEVADALLPNLPAFEDGTKDG